MSDINWDDVISGKTIMVWDAEHGFQDTEFHIIHTFGDSVWFRTNGRGVPLTGHKSDFKNCHIKDRWREITEECLLQSNNDRFSLYYKNNYVLWDDCFGKDAKFKIEGMRVFTCN